MYSGTNNAPVVNYWRYCSRIQHSVLIIVITAFQINLIVLGIDVLLYNA